MRSKEEANDYRYFPCPDLLPVILDDTYIESVKNSMPELSEARKTRFIKEYQLSKYDAETLSGDTQLSIFFESTARSCNDAKLSANWIMGELSARLNTEEINIQDSKVSAEALALLISRIKDQTISNKIAKEVFDGIWAQEGSADEIIEKRGLKQVSDSGALEKMLRAKQTHSSSMKY